MPWSIKTSPSFLFSLSRALLFCAPVPTLLNIMGVFSANIVTSFTQYVRSFSLPLLLKNFGVKQPSTDFLPLFFRTSLHSKDFMVLLLTTLTLKFSIVLALFFSILMNTLNLNHVSAFVAFLVVAQNKKVFVVGTLFLTDFIYLAMSHFGNILCSLTCPPFTPPSLVLVLSSLIHQLIFFFSLSPLLIQSSLNLHLLLQTRTSHSSLMIVLNLLQISLFIVMPG